MTSTVYLPSWVRFSDAKQEGREEASSIGGRRIPTQRTHSFKEKSKTQNWFQRQFSGTMSRDYDTSDEAEYTAAVAAAAAAYAVNSLYNNEITPNTKSPDFEMHDASSTKFRSKLEDASTKMREPTKITNSLSGRNFSDTDLPENSSEKKEGTTTKLRRSKSLTDDSSGSDSSDEKRTSVRKFFGSSSGKAPPIKKKISFAADLRNPKETETAIATKPSFKKRLSFSEDKPSLKKPQTFTDNKLDSIEPLKPDIGFPKPIPRATFMPPPPPPPPPQTRGSRADAWERTELSKIQKRYETLRSRIDTWESTKREKAKRQKEKRERELERKRARVQQHFRREVENIDAVAKGARTEAEKKKQKDELKVKEKANKIRKTGKLPPTFFCF